MFWAHYHSITHLFNRRAILWLQNINRGQFIHLLLCRPQKISETCTSSVIRWLLWWWVHLTLQFARWTPTRTTHYYDYSYLFCIWWMYPHARTHTSHFIHPSTNWAEIHAIPNRFYSKRSGSLRPQHDVYVCMTFKSVQFVNCHIITLHFWLYLSHSRQIEILSASFAEAYSIHIQCVLPNSKLFFLEIQIIQK